jgi:uncharacterized protein YjiS (DUF1127 family)
MATIAHTGQTVHAARPTATLVARAVNAVSNFLRAWKNRREFYHLGQMSDSELADIGLTRTDLTVAVDLPFGSDPTAHLGALAEARLREVEAMARQVS